MQSITRTAPAAYRIAESWVQPGADAYLALRIEPTGASSGRAGWVHIPSFGELDACILEDSEQTASALAEVGSSRVFTPWRSDCTEFYVRGRFARSLLVEGNAESAFEVTGLKSGTGGGVWMELDEGSIEVRSDSLQTCFSSPDDTLATLPSDPETMMHIGKGGCTADGAECRVTPGVWFLEEEEDSLLHATLFHAQLGPLAFRNGRPSSESVGGAELVSATFSAGEGPDAQALARGIESGTRAALERQRGIKLSSSVDAPYFVDISLSSLRIGEVQTRVVRKTSEYKAGERTEDNPDYPRAEDEVERAEEEVEREAREYKERQKLFEEAKEAAVRECHRAADRLEDPTERTIAQSACTVGAVAGTLIQPSRSNLDSAESQLSDARSKLRNTSPTLTIPIMKDWDWDYDVKQYSREASATVLVRSGKHDGSESPEQATFTVSTTWSDYEVESDSEHNVSGHTPDYDAMNSHDRVVAELVADAVPKVAARVGGTCSAASLAAARAEFEAAGLPAPPRATRTSTPPPSRPWAGA